MNGSRSPSPAGTHARTADAHPVRVLPRAVRAAAIR